MRPLTELPHRSLERGTFDGGVRSTRNFVTFKIKFDGTWEYFIRTSPPSVDHDQMQRSFCDECSHYDIAARESLVVSYGSLDIYPTTCVVSVFITRDPTIVGEDNTVFVETELAMSEMVPEEYSIAMHFEDYTS